jgi:hypothetical protein
VNDDFQAWFDRELHALIIDGNRSIGELLSAYDALETEATQALLASDQTDRLLEVRRELASLRLVASKQRGLDPVFAQRLFERCEQLGYASAGLRLNAIAIFARICLAGERPELDEGKLDEALHGVSPGRNPSLEALAAQLRAARGLS